MKRIMIVLIFLIISASLYGATRIGMAYGMSAGAEDGYIRGYTDGKKDGYEEAKTETELQTVVEKTEEEPNEIPSWDVEKVKRIVTQEANKNMELCLAICQCIMNGCKDTGLNPEELCEKYQYTFPATFISKEADDSVTKIILGGETYAPVGDADVFYSTAGGFRSEWHERQEFVCQIGVVRFFRMR